MAVSLDKDDVKAGLARLGVNAGDGHVLKDARKWRRLA